MHALQSAFEAKHGSFGPTCRRPVRLNTKANLADQATIERIRALCADAHEQGRAPHIIGAKETKWAKFYDKSLCQKLMAHVLGDGSPVLNKLRGQPVYRWNVGRIVLLRSRRIEFAQQLEAATGIDDVHLACGEGHEQQS